jgi:hypothetical protein
MATLVRDVDSAPVANVSFNAVGGDMLVVIVGYSASSSSVNWIRFNGIDLTKITRQVQGQNVAEVWYLANPPQGTYTVSFNQNFSSGFNHANISLWNEGSILKGFNFAKRAASGTAQTSVANCVPGDTGILAAISEAGMSNLSGQTALYVGYTSGNYDWRHTYKTTAAYEALNMGVTASSTDTVIVLAVISQPSGKLVDYPAYIGL